MKIGLVNLFSIIFVFSLILSVVLPAAYGEVTSLKSNNTFYKGGSKLYFSGTTATNDPPYVTLVVFDPNDKFVLLTSGMADTNHTFQIIVDSGSQENQPKFSLKGIYNATAFIAQQSAGKTVDFIFSPDGSPIIPSSPTGVKATPYSSTEIDLIWSTPTINGGSPITGYQIERNDGNGFNVIQKTQTVTYQDTGLTPGKQYFYRVSATNSAGTSNPSNVAYATTISAPVQNNPQGSSVTLTQTQTTNGTQAIYEEIQKRIENAKRLQQLLNPKSNLVLLNENLSVGDLIGNVTSSNVGTTENKTPSFDFNNLLYPLIALAGVGVIIAVVYGKKNSLWFSPNQKSRIKYKTSNSEPVEKTSESQEEDYALMILKNRLAKGEITIEEFNRLKDALKEP
jgi:hypothetical protein